MRSTLKIPLEERLAINASLGPVSKHLAIANVLPLIAQVLPMRYVEAEPFAIFRVDYLMDMLLVREPEDFADELKWLKAYVLLGKSEPGIWDGPGAVVLDSPGEPKYDVYRSQVTITSEMLPGSIGSFYSPFVSHFGMSLLKGGSMSPEGILIKVSNQAVPTA